MKEFNAVLTTKKINLISVRARDKKEAKEKIKAWDFLEKPSDYLEDIIKIDFNKTGVF